MPWNEPGKNNSGNQDPWGSGRQKGKRPSNPLDLEKWLRLLISKLRSGGGGKTNFTPSILLALLVAIVAWLASGFYVVGPEQSGVVVRFGAYVQTSNPGPHWHLPAPLAQVYAVDTEQTHSTQSKGILLTQDLNLVEVDVSAQYRVQNAKDYLFNARDPNQILRDALISAIRQVVGQSKMDSVVGVGRADIALQTQALMQRILDGYQIGVEVTKVNLLEGQPPEQVQAAYADAVKAGEDQARYHDQAKAYASTVMTQARGQAARELDDAQSYQEAVIARAQGDVARFNQLLNEYEKAPKVTRERMYIDTMQSVLENSSKVIIDTKGKNLLYLPIEHLGQATSSTAGQQSTASSAAAATAAQADPMQAERIRRDLRSREVR